MGRGEMGRNEIGQKSSNSAIAALSAALGEKLAAVGAEIDARMASDNAPRIPEVTRHLVGAGGKRVRPMLTLASAALLDYRGSNDVRLATAVEFIHTATLLHDDVVDESAQRRGRPTANLLWDNKSSVLVGDYLFSRAFQLMVETGNIRVLDILANASAVIAEGEVLQLSSANSIATSEATYYRIIEGKTAALFAAASEAGVVIAQGSDAEARAARDYGMALGVAFQIVDDLLDYRGAEAEMGKDAGDDFRDRKLTLPVIHALEQADAPAQEFWARCFQQGQQEPEDFARALEILHSTGSLTYAQQAALGWRDKAREALESLPDTEMRTHLAALADFVVARVS